MWYMFFVGDIDENSSIKYTKYTVWFLILSSMPKKVMRNIQ